MFVFGAQSKPFRQRRITAALVVTAACSLAACGVRAGNPAGNNAANKPATQDKSAKLDADAVRDHLIVRYTIANLGRDRSVRNVRQGMVDHGWAPFIEIMLAQLSANDRGLHRVMLHTPFGRERPVQFDGYLEAKKMPVLDKVTGTFVEAWRDNVTDPSLNRDIEVIGYIGSPRKDPESQRILEEQGKQAFWKRAWSAVDPLLQANMSIGLDAASAAQKDSMTYRLAEKLRERDVEVYTEASPRASHEWWFDYPVIVLETTWQERQGNPEFASRGQLQRELIRIVRLGNNWTNRHDAGAWPQAACRIIAEGDTAAVPGRLLLEPKRSIEGLVECVNKMRD